MTAPSTPIPPAPAAVSKRRRAFGAIALCTLALVPLLLPNYRVFQINLGLVYAIALFGLNLLTGYNGQISLGHGAFYAVGAYTAAILMETWGVPYWVVVPIAGVVSFVVGYLFGLPALRLAGHYLALATFALAVALPQLLKYKLFEPFTGGVQGIVFTAKPDAPFGIPLSSDRWLYLFTLAVLVPMFLAGRSLLQGRIGRALVAIRDHPVAAEAMGIDTARYKATAFGISALYTGVAGALGAIVVQFVSPDSFAPFLSISFLVGIVIGGLASVSGAIYGGMFIEIVPTIAEQISKSAPWAVYGVVLIAFVRFAPRGVAGWVEQVSARISGRHRTVHANDRRSSP